MSVPPLEAAGREDLLRVRGNIWKARAEAEAMVRYLCATERDAIGQEACGMAFDLGRELAHANDALDCTESEVVAWRKGAEAERGRRYELEAEVAALRAGPAPLYPLVLDDALVSMLERRNGSVRVEELRGAARKALANRRRMAELLAQSAMQIADLEKRLESATLAERERCARKAEARKRAVLAIGSGPFAKPDPSYVSACDAIAAIIRAPDLRTEVDGGSAEVERGNRGGL